MIEKRLLQLVVALACLVPLLAGGAGVLAGTDFLYRGELAGLDLDSHFRYLSGLLLGIGLGFLSCIPAIETKGERMRVLAAVVFVGGLARLGGVALEGMPGPGHVFGLVMELGVTPALALWRDAFERRYRSTVGR